jgi:transposase-like protein
MSREQDGTRDELRVLPETEGARRATGVSGDGADLGHPDPEIPGKARRRQFSAEYRLRILREAEACKEPGALGALLRREGLYSSLLSTWRRQREEGALIGLRARKRGPRPPSVPASDSRLQTRSRSSASPAPGTGSSAAPRTTSWSLPRPTDWHATGW